MDYNQYSYQKPISKSPAQAEQPTAPNINDRSALPREPLEGFSSINQYSRTAERLPPFNNTVQSILNPLSEPAEPGRRLPSLQSVLGGPLRRDTTSPERYSIAYRSPDFDERPPLLHRTSASNAIPERWPPRPLEPVAPHVIASPISPGLIPPTTAMEFRRYSQPVINQREWDIAALAPLSQAITVPERLSLSRLNSGRPALGFGAFAGPASAPLPVDDRRDSARTGSTGSNTASLEVVGQAEVPGKGLCYVYQDGSVCPTVIDDHPVNPAWGTTKAGKARKRLAQACLPCREKKIRCEPRPNGCLQCEKSRRACRMPPSQQQGPEGPNIILDTARHSLTTAVSMPDFRARMMNERTY